MPVEGGIHGKRIVNNDWSLSVGTLLCMLGASVKSLFTVLSGILWYLSSLVCIACILCFVLVKRCIHCSGVSQVNVRGISWFGKRHCLEIQANVSGFSSVCVCLCVCVRASPFVG